MKIHFFLSLILTFPFFAVKGGAEEEWRDLLDESLSQWEVFTGVPHKSVEIPGRDSTSSEDGINGEPIGLSDPFEIYTVERIDGELVLKVSGQVFGALSTRDEFESYHLTLQFRWGDKKWEPRLDKKRDSGLLFHCVGRHGVGWNAWMQSLECQIQEGDCGDFIPVADARARVPFREGKEKELVNYELGVYDPDSPLKEVSGAIVAHSGAVEREHGEWNTIEIYTIGRKSVFLVNGTPNMAVFDAEQQVDGEYQALTRGKLQIQSEAAEIDFRRIKLRQIKEFPQSLAKHVSE